MISCKYTGTFPDSSGYGSANRSDIVSLFINNVDVTTESLIQMADRTNYGFEGLLCTHLEDRTIDYKIKILHITPDLYPKYLEPGKYHIGRLFWETNQLPKEWVNPCNQVQEIWTLSEQQAKMIRDSGVTVPIKWFPQATDISVIEKNIKSFVIPNFEGLTFFSTFQWILRKNPEALLKTYWKTFEGHDDVCLAVKTYGVTYSEDNFTKIKSEVSRWKSELKLKHYPKIYLIKKLFTQSEMERFYKDRGVYINTSCGEGFGRPVVEAGLMGNPIISIDKTGFTDYLPKDFYYAIPSKEIHATQVPQIPWYTNEMLWLDIDREQLGIAMMQCYNDKKAAQEKAKKAQAFIKDRFNYWKVGEAMKARLEQISQII